ncbi:MAG: CNNM domain-containing protein [Candidatus Omnitrophota bacterium]
MMLYFYIIGCVFFILLQAFFAASEISFISSRLIKLRHRQAKGDWRAEEVYRLMLEPERFLATTLIGTNISLVISSSLLTFFLIKIGVGNSNVWITLLYTPVIVIFAELIPKNIGRLFREEFNCRVSRVLTFFEKLFFLGVRSIDGVTKFLVKTFIGKVKRKSLFVTKEEIKFIIKEIEKEGGIDKGEQQAIEDVFDFRVDNVRDVSMDLEKVVTVNYSDSYDHILKIAKKSGLTRYPVFSSKEKNKEIIGYINIYDLFYNPLCDWKKFIRPLTKINANQKLYEAFTLLKSKKESIALVIKDKKVYGIVTLQDLIREILTSIIKI